MRVECHSIEDFMVNMAAVKSSGAGHVYDKVVYVDINRRPVDGDRFRALKFDVVIQASVVMDRLDGQYLVVAGEECGRDFSDQGGERSGSDRADALRKMIADYCKDRGLEVRPGVVGE